MLFLGTKSHCEAEFAARMTDEDEDNISEHMDSDTSTWIIAFIKLFFSYSQGWVFR